MIKISMVRILFAVVILSSNMIVGCMSGEVPVPAHEVGDMVTGAVNMDATYKYQVYYSLASNSTVTQNLKTDWDLAFSTGADDDVVWLNMAKTMTAYAVDGEMFDQVTLADTINFYKNKTWDSPTGSKDSTAIGKWSNEAKVYIVERGFDEMGKHLGWAKVQLLGVDDKQYELAYALLPNGTEQRVTITKDDRYNYGFLSFTEGVQVTVEPPKESWDIVFTQYTHVFQDDSPPTLYMVTGCLLNSFNTTAYVDTIHAFEQITFANVDAALLKPDRNVIGYDWKVLTASFTYTVNTKKTYIVRDSKGLIYKMRFTGFYNSAGAKGNPQWEMQQL